MRLDLRFSERPLEDLWCQAVTALVFQRPEVTKGALSGLNDKMAGSLADLVEKEIWTGKRGESFLLASQNMINSEKLLFYGLGQGQDYDNSILEHGIRELGSTLDKIGVNEFGIHIPVAEGVEEEYDSHIELSARHIVEPFFKNHNNDPDFLLKIINSVESDHMDIIAQVEKRLRKHFTPILDFSIIIDRNPEVLTSGSTG